MLNWNDLQFFLQLARNGRLTKAATNLNVDQTTVSRRISALEEQLDVRLFDRSPRGFQLTDAGMRLVPHAENMESDSNLIYQDIAGKDASFEGTVRIATPEALGSQVIARHIDQFRELYPDIQIELIAETRRTSLSKREADIAITLSRPRSGRMIAWKLCDYRLRIYGSSHYLDRFEPIRKLDDLNGHDFVSYIDDLIEMPELRYLASTVKNAHVVFHSSNIIAQFNAILDGVGLGVVHCFMAKREPALQEILPEQTSIDRSYWLVVHEDLRHVARVDAVCRFLTQILEQNRDLMLGEN